MRLKHRKWRHHGLGMLQSEISPTLRIHIWHPALRANWFFADPFRCVHDHRFDLHSTVLVGKIIDEPWSVIGTGGKGNTAMWSVVHAKEAARRIETVLHGNGLTEYLTDVFAMAQDRRTFEAGNSYTIARGDFHTTPIDDLVITLVHRSNFGDRPARVLGSRAEHGIVAFDAGAERALWEEVLTLAEGASQNIDL